MARTKKKSTKQAKRAKQQTGGEAHELRWMPEVSESGELFLRRREVTSSGEPGEMNYPFSQGLIFLARRWRNLMNEELRAVGQSQARWGTLYWIKVLGDTMNQTMLADRIGVEQPTLGRVLRDLESEGLIERSPGKGDRRAKTIRLTAEATPVLREINRIQNSVRTKLLQDIEPRELSTCLAVFAKILANMDRHWAG